LAKARIFEHRIKHHAMKPSGRTGYIAPCFLNLGPRWNAPVAILPRREPGTYTVWLVCLHSHSERTTQNINVCSCWELNPDCPIVQPEEWRVYQPSHPEFLVTDSVPLQ